METRVIVDNNVWISALLGYQRNFICELIRSQSTDIYVCKELFDEFVAVSSREKIFKKISKGDIANMLQIMLVYCNYVPIAVEAISDIRDKKDLYLLSLADTVKADYIITGDKDLLELKAHNNTRIITIKEFREFSSCQKLKMP